MKKIGILQFFLIWSFAASSCFCQCENIPFQRDGALIKIPVTINGAITLYFIFDTGASKMVIARDLFKLLRKRTDTTKFRFIGKVLIKDVTGDTTVFDGYVFDNVSIGSKMIKNVEILVSPSENSFLVIGQNIISRLGRYYFDNQEMLMRLGDSYEISITSPLSNDSVEKDVEISGKTNRLALSNYLLIQWTNNLTIEPIRFISNRGLWKQNITLGDQGSHNIIYTVTAVATEDSIRQDMSFSNRTYYSNPITLIRK